MVRKGKSSTRNTEFNYYESSSGHINSIANYKLNSVQTDIKLIEATDYIRKTGLEINKDAAKNTNDDQYIKKVVNIDTGLDSDDTPYYIYGSPDRLVLDNRQQYNNCGVEGILNVLVMAGLKTITNQNSVEKSFTKELWNRGLVQDDGKLGVFDRDDGGTRVTDYRDILVEYGITSEAYASDYFATTDPDSYSTTLDYIANTVKLGGAAIVAVSSYLLWHEYEKGTNNDIDPDKCILNHAVTVTGVVYDTDNPDDSTLPVGFYIHDTGVWMTRYISLEEMKTVTLSEKTDYEWKDKTGVFGAVITDNIKSWINNINATGNNRDNTITGNSGNNVIKGMGGDDTLVGGAGNDTIYGGKGNDFIYGNDASKDGNDEITGNNTLYGENGTDHIYGGSYNDVIYGGNDNDYLYGNDGIDVIYGGKGNDKIYGGDYDDRLLGEAGNDEIYGGNGDDTIIGGAGNDIINGESGFDKIDCGSGDDTVIFYSDCQEDTLTSSSGSVTLIFDSVLSVNNLVYDLSGNVFGAGYDNDNFVMFTNFYNSKNNTYKKAYLKCIDKIQYRVSATNSRGNVKVAEKTGNNIFFSLNKNSNNITTSTGNDIIFMYEGDDTVTYTGGRDYYYSTHGNDTYKTDLFNSNSSLHIYDALSLDGSPSGKDKLEISTDIDNLNLFFDINSDKTKSSNLYFIYNDESTYMSGAKLDNIISDNNQAGGFIQITDYFGKGKIETISANDDVITNIDTVVASLVENVATWLVDNGQTSAFAAIHDNVEGVNDLIQLYGFNVNT